MLKKTWSGDIKRLHSFLLLVLQKCISHKCKATFSMTGGGF